MSEKPNQFRIGLFVLVGVGIVLGALFLFGIRSAFHDVQRFETYVTGDVEGLSKGSAVKLRGVAVGKVTEIGFSWNLYENVNPRCVVVRFAVDERASPISTADEIGPELQKSIDRGLRAIVQSEGITGSSIVALQNLDPAKYPPLQVPWKPEYYYIPSAPSQLGQILASVDRILQNLEKLDVAKISASATRTLDSADAALRKLGDLDFSGVSRNVNQLADDASSAVLEVRGLAEDARKTLQGMQLEAVGKDAGRLVSNLDSRLSILIEKLDGLDVRALNETFAGTRDAARNLNEALEELKKHPSGFLFGGAPPPAAGLDREKK
jgi:phospholipid/cholesterol/gamma-HCH transport system substrate-binding protein